LEFIATLPEGQQAALREEALLSWGTNRPDTFFDWLRAQPVEGLPKNFKSIEVAAGQEPERFAAWLSTLPPDELRDRSQLTLAKQLANQGRVSEALARFPQNSTFGVSSQAAREFGTAIAARDPNAAAQWVTSLPAGGPQSEAGRGLVSSWAAKAPDAAAQWVKALPSGALRDAATGALAGVFAKADPEAATVWLEQIGSANVRSSAAQQVYRTWTQTDPTGARDWLATFGGMSDLAKARLLRSRP
jgi:hypothetical protein